MLHDFSDSETLFQAAQTEGLYLNLVIQLQKDFTMANISINITADIKSSQLKTLIHEKIYYLLLEKFQAYLHLLYVIDVPEKAFEEIPISDAVEVAEKITLLVFNRELQKVRLKAKYA